MRQALWIAVAVGVLAGTAQAQTLPGADGVRPLIPVEQDLPPDELGDDGSPLSGAPQGSGDYVLDPEYPPPLQMDDAE